MMGQLLLAWKTAYLERFTAARYVSLSAAVAFISISLVETAGVVSAARSAETLADGILFQAMVTPFVFIGTFGARLVYLAIGRLSLLGNCITFGLCVACTYILTSLNLYRCVWDCDPEAAFPMYSLFSTFPLETAGSVFVAAGLMKFSVTAFLAAGIVNE